MNEKQLRELAKMKRLIHQGYRRFAYRKDRDLNQELACIGIDYEQVWKEILSLSSIHYVYDFKPYYYKKGNDALVFKKTINRQYVYIKLKIESNESHEETVCLSFHRDGR